MKEDSLQLTILKWIVRTSVISLALLAGYFAFTMAGN
ncbi:MAG: hypothetical protein JWR61_1153 [Ferruginibacter sp.]|nr:hypothetical protein [Ferruginibacter sp.]